MTSRDSHSATGSRVLAAGQRHFDWQDGAMTEQCGQVPAPASHSPPPADSEGLQMHGTSGQSGSASSKPAARRSSSASKSHPQKLSARSLKLLSLTRFSGAITPPPTDTQTDSLNRNLLEQIVGGSMEYVETWRLRVTPSGRQYWEHTASGRRTSDSDCGGSEAGWPTPQAKEQDETSEKKVSRGAHAGLNLRNAAELVFPAGYPTPQARDGKGVPGDGSGNSSLPRTAGWVTPSARDHKDTPGMAAESTNNDGTTRQRVDQLPRQVYHLLPGMEPSGSNAETEKRGVLSPDLSRWLMGYPAVWLSCVDWETLSSRK